jgi:predicted kinase
MSKIQVLVGMVASGKSTYAKNAAEYGFVCVNDDAIVSMLHAGDYTLYDKSLKPIYKTIEVAIVTSALQLGRSVIIDKGTSGRAASRARWIAIANSFDLPCEAVVFPRQQASEHARRRFESDSRGLSMERWLRVAEEHELDYSEPTEAEGFDLVRKITWKEIQAGEVVL